MCDFHGRKSSFWWKIYFPLLLKNGIWCTKFKFDNYIFSNFEENTKLNSDFFCCWFDMLIIYLSFFLFFVFGILQFLCNVSTLEFYFILSCLSHIILSLFIDSSSVMVIICFHSLFSSFFLCLFCDFHYTCVKLLTQFFIF